MLEGKPDDVLGHEAYVDEGDGEDVGLYGLIDRCRKFYPSRAPKGIRL